MIQKGAQNTVEGGALRRGQGPYIHTRKEAVSMTAKQMVSNDPNLYKVSLILSSNLPGVDGHSECAMTCVPDHYIRVVQVCHKMSQCRFPIDQFLNTHYYCYTVKSDECIFRELVD